MFKVGDWIKSNFYPISNLSNFLPNEPFEIIGFVGKDLMVKDYFGKEFKIIALELKTFNKVKTDTLSKSIKAKYEIGQLVEVKDIKAYIWHGFAASVVGHILTKHLIYLKNKKPSISYRIKNVLQNYYTDHIAIKEKDIKTIINYNQYWAKLNEL